MVVDVKANVEWLKEFQKKFWNMPIKKTFESAIKKIIIMLEGESIKEAPVDRWQLRSSFVTKFSSLKWVLSNQQKYAIFVHEWTRPHSAPFQPIQDRARNKWIPRFPVRLSIKRKWTKANPFMQRAIDTVDPKIDKIFSDEIDSLFRKYNLK